MNLATFILGIFCGALMLAVTAFCLAPDRVTPWSVEILRTTDARGMTYSSLHNTQGEPNASGASLRWTDENGVRWIFANGALAHELQTEQNKP
jgi:hypothetical protein